MLTPRNRAGQSLAGRTARRRGVVAVQVALFMVAIMGFAALTIDIGYLQNTRADLQRTADAAALAAAARLADFEYGDPVQLARYEAMNLVTANEVMNKTVYVDPYTDVTFYRANYDPDGNLYTLTPTEELPDAVRVEVRLTNGSSNGPVQLLFARIFGHNEAEMAAQATAVMVPRDIAIVADLSASHNDDSEFYHYKTTEINAWEVWDGFPGGYGEAGSVWNPDEVPPEWVSPEGGATQAAGPAWGYFKQMGFGTKTITSTYNPASDTGLVQLKYNYDWSNAQLEAYLYAQGYIASEVNAMMSADYDSSGAYQYRVAAALGLSFWNSGHPGGLWEQRGVPPASTGNGNDWVGASEIEWTEAFGDRSLSASQSIFLNYINSYMKSTSTQLYRANSNFYCRYGVKSFVNYLLENRPSNEQTPELAGTPHQPMQAVKDAVNFMTDLIHDLQTDDKLSLEVYGTVGRHELDLTHDHLSIGTRMDELQAGHYDSYTNVGDGLNRAIEELNSDRARGASRKMIILLTDGNANRPSSNAKAYARERAEIAAAQGIRIFAVSVGAGADQGLMEEIADIGHGEHFHAGGDVAEYSAELAEIFRRLGGQRPVELIE